MQKTIILLLVSNATVFAITWKTFDSTHTPRDASPAIGQGEMCAVTSPLPPPPGTSDALGRPSAEPSSHQTSSALAPLTAAERRTLTSALLAQIRAAAQRPSMPSDNDDNDARKMPGDRQEQWVDDPSYNTFSDLEAPEHIVEVEDGTNVAFEDLEARFQDDDGDPVAGQEIEASMLEVMNELDIPEHLLMNLKCQPEVCRVAFDVSDREQSPSVSRLTDSEFGRDFRFDIQLDEHGEPQMAVAFFARPGYALNGEILPL